MVKAIFFDLSDTLQEFDWDKQWALLEALLNLELDIKIDSVLLKQKYQQCYEFYRLGKINNDFDFFDLLFRQLAVNVSKKQIKLISKKHLEIRKQFTHLPQNYSSTLTELKKHFILAIVSSGVWPWGDYDFEKIFGFKMKKHFDLIVNSYEEGYLKESGKLFEIALKKLKLNPADVVYVGNNFQTDVLVAKNFGMKTVFLNKKNEFKEGDITINSFSQLMDKIEELKRL
jgi:putative hydrolase of the HAD superfamily